MKTFKQLRAEQAAHPDEEEDKKLIGQEIKAKVKPEALKNGEKEEKPAEKPETDEDEGEKEFGESVDGKDGAKNLAKQFAKSSMGRAQKMQKDRAKESSKEHKKDTAYENVQQVEEEDSIEGLARKAARAHAMRISAKIDADKKRRKEEGDKFAKAGKPKNEGVQAEGKSPFSIPEPTAKSRKGTYGTSHKSDDADHKADEPAAGDSKAKHSADALANAFNLGVKPAPSEKFMKQAAAGFVKGVSVRQHKMQDTDESIEYYIVKEGVAYHFVFEADGEIIAMGRAPTANGAAMMAERMIESALAMVDEDTPSALEIAKRVALGK